MFVYASYSSKLPLPKKRLPTPRRLRSMRTAPQRKRRMAILRKVTTMTKPSDREAQKKREKIQRHFWNIVGSVEHISLPKLEDAVRKEFNCQDDWLVQAQINLMQTEARIRVQSNVKVWIKQPPTSRF